MNRSLGRVPTVAAVAIMLSGCSFSTGVPNAPVSNASALNAKSGDLLYVANGSSDDGVSVLTFPQGQPVTTIKDNGTPLGICSDTSGNVWVAVYDAANRATYMIEFAHGGTKPIQRLRALRFSAGCAVDPTTGDLANLSANGKIEVWPGARKGKARFYSIEFEPTSGGYDDKGNLFVDGVHGSTFNLYFAVLPKGGNKFENITLTKFASWNPGSVQWDGHYVTIGVTKRYPKPYVVYRLQMSGTVGKVVGVVHLQDLADAPHYWIAGDKIVATQRARVVRHLGLYDYPAGGQRIQLYSNFDKPVGVTVSVPPK